MSGTNGRAKLSGFDVQKVPKDSASAWRAALESERRLHGGLSAAEHLLTELQSHERWLKSHLRSPMEGAAIWRDYQQMLQGVAPGAGIDSYLSIIRTSRRAIDLLQLAEADDIEGILQSVEDDPPDAWCLLALVQAAKQNARTESAQTAARRRQDPARNTSAAARVATQKKWLAESAQWLASGRSKARWCDEVGELYALQEFKVSVDSRTTICARWLSPKALAKLLSTVG
jgi:hypothetical protein